MTINVGQALQFILNNYPTFVVEVQDFENFIKSGIAKTRAEEDQQLSTLSTDLAALLQHEKDVAAGK